MPPSRPALEGRNRGATLKSEGRGDKLREIVRQSLDIGAEVRIYLVTGYEGRAALWRRRDGAHQSKEVSGRWRHLERAICPLE